MAKRVNSATRRRMSQMFTECARLFDVESDGKTITLPESNAWMTAAKVLDGKTITERDTTTMFKKFKTDAITLKQYKQFIEDLAQSKGLTPDDLYTKLAGVDAKLIKSIPVS